jgi:hypothetical protein
LQVTSCWWLALPGGAASSSTGTVPSSSVGRFSLSWPLFC